jgi:bifunctional non-homologous end joining protein LigD
MARMNKSRKTIQVSAAQSTAIKPMLATLIKEPFNDPNYIHEVKWDGYRIIAYKSDNKVKLESRGGHDYTKKYPAVAKALSTIEDDFIVDGEIVYINNKGKPDFDELQSINGQKAPLIYYVFDLLHLNGENMMKLPLLQRKELLSQLLPEHAIVKLSDHFDDGVDLYNHIKKLGLEGIVSKDKNSPYIPDERGKKWYKIPVEQKGEYVIGGWVESENRDTFRTLLFGEYENGKLKWIGHAGGGYKEHEMPKILERLQQIEIAKSPFVNEVKYSEGKPHWVKPVLVANVKFATFTKSGKIRKPAIFQGFREDKVPLQVVKQVAQEHIEREKVLTSKPKHNKGVTSEDSNWPKLEIEKIISSAEVDIDGCRITLTNVEKEIWKGVTKAQLIEYYLSIYDYMYPHLKDRPLSLHSKHQGVNVQGVYIKDMEGRQPECSQIFTTPRKHKKPGKRDVIDYLVVNNKATLLFTINKRCIDVNPWTSTTDHPENPDFIIIDLDPSDDDFSKSIDVAKAVKEFLDKRKIQGFPKTSGKTGIHIYLPCTGFDFAQARRIASNICDSIYENIADLTTRTKETGDRESKVYLDDNQNDYSDTVACVYSVRPFKHPNVSTPLEWKEIRPGLVPETFNINSIFKRLEKKGDLFLPVLDKKIAGKNDRYLTSFL